MKQKWFFFQYEANLPDDQAISMTKLDTIVFISIFLLSNLRTIMYEPNNFFEHQWWLTSILVTL